MSPALTDRHEAKALAGSFWSGSIDPEQAPLIGALTRINETRIGREFEFLKSRLTGQGYAVREQRTLRVAPKDVILFGVDLQRRALAKFDGGYTLRPVAADAREDGMLLVGEDAVGTDGGIIIFPIPGTTTANPTQLDQWQTRWLVALTEPIVPLVLRGLTGDLVVGVDFLCRDGVLHFFQNPCDLFELPAVVVVSCEMPAESVMHYTLKCDQVFAGNEALVAYKRKAQTPDNFGRALAVVAGMAVLVKAGKLIEVLPLAFGYRYVFAEVVVEADYTHEPLTKGNTYPEGYIVGQQIKLTTGMQKGWYRALDWSSGLSLDGLCPFSGLTAPDAQRRAYTTTALGDGRYNVRIQLDGPEDVQERFWTRVAQGERRSGKYLFDLLGMTGAGSLSVNPVDVFFDLLLERNALVIDLNGIAANENLSRVLRFIADEKPTGVVVITRVSP